MGVGLMLASVCADSRATDARAPHIVWWVLAILPIPWLQYQLNISLFAGDALIVSLYLCALAAAVWLGFCYASGETEEPGKQLISVFYVLWIAALASAAIGLLQWLSLEGVFALYLLQTDAGDRAMGNLGQPNQLATLLLMGMAALAWTYERKRIGACAMVLGIAFLTLVLVLTQSRAGMLSAGAVAAFLVWKHLASPGRIAPKHVLTWLMSYWAALQLLPLLHSALLMPDSRSMNPGVDNARLTIWKQVINGIAESPWWGFGWNQTPTAHAAGSLAVPGSGTYTNAHSVILDIVAWNGIPLGLLLTAAVAYWFVSRMRGASHVNAVYAMACLLPFAVHSMVEFPFAYAYFLIAAGLMVGIVEATHTDSKTIRVGLRWVGCVLALWVAVGSYMIYEYLLIEEDFVIVRFENLRTGKTPADYKVPRIWMLSHMGAMLKAARQQPEPGMSPQDLDNMRRVSSRFAYGAVRFRYALALGLNGDPLGATKQMAIVRGMYGDFYYEACTSALRQLQAEKYPELSRVLTPR